MEGPVSLAFPPHPAWVRTARETIRTLLSASGHSELTDSAVLLTSEAVANAINACAAMQLVHDLDALFGWTPLDDRAVTRAWDVQRELTEKGRHRSAGAVDLLVAATAELRGLTMLHYDHDFETISSVTGQPTQWLAAPGSL
ncbi:PIN domain-containing protein [Streptomyces ossamyceticus]|uniref:PIN domain-containing protein n=1 Tax=Streptomyces ossamyceticus TaxID=249581 RepID=A0ABV2UUI6_9ACTN